jgi:hypothetical protein
MVVIPAWPGHSALVYPQCLPNRVLTMNPLCGVHDHPRSHHPSPDIALIVTRLSPNAFLPAFPPQTPTSTTTRTADRAHM